MDINENKIFWDSSIEELTKGYVERDAAYHCIVCGEEFEKGRIFKIESNFYDAEKTAELHVESEHGSMLTYILGMNSAFTGISEIQQRVLNLMAQGLSDKEVAKELGVSQSTIRNHRFKLRQREKQAKVFLAMMELLSKDSKGKITKLEKEVICDPHKTAAAVDDRFNITDKEKKTVLKTYMDESGALKSYPAKAKKKVIVLEEISKNFTKGKHYSEKEINRILKRIFEDYATIRRALIEYGFIDRTNDGSSYWVKE